MGRDYIILPLLSLLTVFVMLLGGECVSRKIYADGPSDSCLVHDASLGFRFKPNCTSEVKIPESAWVTNRYNSCGYRTLESCGPKPANTLRIALLGSSVAFGLYVPYEQTIPTQLARNLTVACGEPVEVQNLASEYEFWSVVVRRFDSAMELQPDAVIVVGSPTDIGMINPALSETEGAKPPPELLSKVRNLFADSRLRVVTQHFMYGDAAFYLSLYRNSVTKTYYMREPLSPVLQRHIKAYAEMLGGFADRSRRVPLPIMLAYLPQRAQVGFAADVNRPAYLFPFALDNALGEASTSLGVFFADTTPVFVRDSRQMDLFTRSDGHMNSDGDMVAAQSIARQVVRDLAPFKHCDAAKLTSKQGYGPVRAVTGSRPHY